MSDENFDELECAIDLYMEGWVAKDGVQMLCDRYHLTPEQAKKVIDELSRLDGTEFRSE